MQADSLLSESPGKNSWDKFWTKDTKRPKRGGGGGGKATFEGPEAKKGIRREKKKKPNRVVHKPSAHSST